MIRLTIYNEYYHERDMREKYQKVRDIYPNGLHTVIADKLTALAPQDFSIRFFFVETAAEITKEVLAQTDVLIWWGHCKHEEVPDEVAQNVTDAVHGGMGAIFLHSGHHSKPFKLLMGTPCSLTWREDGDRELVWTIDPAHPIAKGIGRFIKLDGEETYGEPFSVPEPDELVFIGNFEGGEVFRAGCCYKRGNGRVFYFQPGHESYPTYHNDDIIRVIYNAIHWANPVYRRDIDCPHVKKPLED
ncbi:MAG: ThuA domain-containing protein [Clostridia bacterium]|nr:ThuA domain-containing protein [Clostridia bacterium]